MQVVEGTTCRESDHVVIGVIVRAVGLEGWLKVRLLTDFPQRLGRGNDVLVCRGSSEPGTHKIVETRPVTSGDFLDFRLEGVTDRDAARLLVGCELVIPRVQRRPAPHDSYYADELAGMTVRDSSGQEVATVVALEESVPAPYLRLKDAQEREILVPFRRVFIARIDRDSRTLLLAGLLEEHLPS